MVQWIVHRALVELVVFVMRSYMSKRLPYFAAYRLAHTGDGPEKSR